MAVKIEIEVNHPHGSPDLSCPVVVCDVCGERIEDAAQGMYAWDTPEDEKAREEDFAGRLAVELYMVHKGRCLDALDSYLPSGHAMTMELRCLPVYLGRNLGIETDADWKQAQRVAAWSAG